MATKQHLEKYSVWCNKICTFLWQATIAKDVRWLVINSCQKRGDVTGYDGFKRISGTKIHVAVDCNSLPVSIVLSSANQHDSTKLIDVMKNIDDTLDDKISCNIKKVYADKGYDSTTIREYLRNRNIKDCIPYRINSRIILQNNTQNNYNKTRYVVERFFAWLKCGFRKMVIRYERIAENYLGFLNIASFLMYYRVLGWVDQKKM